MLVYRKELDGLRALAVIAVIIYHAHVVLSGFHVVQGGFFGVDIFFVLSGYLITGIIRNEMEKQSFSLLNFYWRRAKRIIPALITVLIATTILSYFILLPDDLVNFVQSLKSTLYFGSNYHFYGQDSYTSDSSIYKPLLHTWSLAVEWQFYIVYPIIVWLINRFFHQYLFSILLLLALTSLWYANYIVFEYPDEAFYLLPSRAWELILGGLITFYDRTNLLKATHGSLESFIYKLLPSLGLFLVIFSFFSIDQEVLHPSYLTLIPVLGTCLLIMFTHNDELANDVLSLKPFVFIGLISYSLYLWHQPIFVFFRLLESENIRPEQSLLLIVISIVLAFITYKTVEKIYRAKKLTKAPIFYLVISGIVLLGGTQAISITHSISGNFSDEGKQYYDNYKVVEYLRLKNKNQIGKMYTGEKREECDSRTVETACQYGDGRWITLGDSYTGQFEYALLERLEKLGSGMIAYSHQQCPFVSPSIWFGRAPECSVVNDDRLRVLSELKGKHNIIVATNYEQFEQPKKRLSDPIEAKIKHVKGGEKLDPDIAWKSYAGNIRFLLDQGHDVYVLYPVPVPFTDVKKLFLSQVENTSNKFRTQYSNGTTAFREAHAYSQKLDQYLPLHHPRLHRIIPTDILCNENEHCMIINETGGLYNHNAHLSYYGLQLVLDKIVPLATK